MVRFSLWPKTKWQWRTVTNIEHFRPGIPLSKGLWIGKGLSATNDLAMAPSLLPCSCSEEGIYVFQQVTKGEVHAPKKFYCFGSWRSTSEKRGPRCRKFHVGGEHRVSGATYWDGCNTWHRRQPKLVRPSVSPRHLPYVNYELNWPVNETFYCDFFPIVLLLHPAFKYCLSVHCAGHWNSEARAWFFSNSSLYHF